MQKFASLDDAIALATFAHRNQKDKAGLDYIEHPRRVLAKVQAQGALPYVQIAAILHDVTEDTKFTPQMLIELGFSEAAVNIIELVDRNESSRRFDIINAGRDVDSISGGNKVYSALGPEARNDFYYQSIRRSPGALMVKEADIEDNLSPWRLNYLAPETQQRLQRKYHRARLVLSGYDEAAVDQAMEHWDYTFKGEI